MFWGRSKKWSWEIYSCVTEDIFQGQKIISSLEYISTEILKLREYIIKDEEKQFNATSSFGYIQYPSISHSGLHLPLSEEGLVRLYHLLAPVLTLYFDASGSFI